MKKRISALVLILVLALTLFACGPTDNPPADDGSRPSQTPDSGTPTPTAEPTPTPTPTAEPTPTEEPTPTPTADPTPTPDSGTPTPTAEPTPTPTPTPTPGATVSVGDIIQLGGYDWRVLEVRDGQALLLSDRILDRAYPSTVGLIWEQSDIRSYLNGEFFNNTFSAAERERITQTSVITNDNPWFGTAGGGTTTDRIFLLSIEEVVRYFGDSGDLARGPGEITDGPHETTDDSGTVYVSYSWERWWINDQYNSNRIAYDTTGTASRWWLRSPSYSLHGAPYVYGDGSIVFYSYGHYYVGASAGGVRPAMWLEL